MLRHGESRDWMGLIVTHRSTRYCGFGGQLFKFKRQCLGNVLCEITGAGRMCLRTGRDSRPRAVDASPVRNHTTTKTLGINHHFITTGRQCYVTIFRRTAFGMGSVSLSAFSVAVLQILLGTNIHIGKEICSL
ncbi:hypothetical protein TNIN_383311 [Trichonephila inaurata madagascariensis]|uniref:Uncharacterized protein n=1 Tax=Trichonephila inaurata madagascariensis TaxID=2747483 RepID=A0A8X6YE60_9ARAC|nr:hypothetical protein TNIN_383311 [Trichonephila inaurata madagascariensis]